MPLPRKFIAPIIIFFALINTSFIDHNSGTKETPFRKTEKINTVDSDIDDIRSSIGIYIWPTDASNRITSSFAEYRTNHFHGGIDISTNGQTGYKVLAVQDGYVSRIKITPNGYGKMLFVRHNDGYVSTYAHLKSFNEAITKVTRTEQFRKETYSVDLILDSVQLPVNQGDIIAYTGETGFGPPHLHFELRDHNLNPINPLLSGNYTIPDNIPPHIRRVMVTPIGYSSTIDNSSAAKYFSRFPRSKRQLTIPQSIRAHGLVGFGVDAVDRTDGVWGRTGIHGMDFYLDDRLIFSMELNKVPVDETKQIDLHYDLESILEGKGKFQKLYIDQGNSLPFYNSKPEAAGIINTDLLTEGSHEYRIVCTDIQGNASTLTGTIIANHRPEINISSYTDNEIVLSGNNLESIDKCFVYGKRSFQTIWSQHTLIKGRFEISDKELRLPINTKPYDVVKVVAATQAGSLSLPIFHFIKKTYSAVRDIHIKSDILKDYILFTLTTEGVFTETPELIVHEGSSNRSLSANAIEINKYQATFLPSDSYHGERAVEVNAEVNGKAASSSATLTLYPIPTDKSGRFSTREGLSITYDSGAVYTPLFLQVQYDNDNRLSSYKLEPADELLHKGIKVSVPINSSSIDKNNLGLYYRLNGGWIFQTQHVDSGSNTFSTLLTHKLGELAVMQDEVQPSFGYIRVKAGSSSVYISFRYHDNLSGVDTDEIKMYIDGKLVIPEIDGEHSRVWYQYEEQLLNGKHNLEIKMKDRAKNETKLIRNFTIR
jgi:hypothetical protein